MAMLLRSNSRSFISMQLRMSSSQMGDMGQGAGKGGGGGGSVRAAGGSLGKKQAAEEEMYFRRKELEKLTALKKSHQEVQEQIESLELMVNQDGNNRHEPPPQSSGPVSSVRVAPPRPRGSGPYRLATWCLAMLCAVLVISLIAVTLRSPEVINTVPVTSTAPPTTGPCPNRWQLYNGSCYFISSTKRDWQDSQNYCKEKGAHLAIILDAQEQSFLWELLPRAMGWNAYWIGITDSHTEDTWKWVDGTPLVGGFWEDGEPNKHIDEDCGFIIKTRHLERVAVKSWYDSVCSLTFFFICEKEIVAAE